MPDKEQQLKIFPIFSLAGALIIMFAFLIGITLLTPTASDYFGDNDKATRDNAASGSDLNDDLVTLKSVPKWLEPLIFLGVASFMFGIALEFSTIPNILKGRAAIMKAAFPKIVGGKK